jgi:CheY-like chemotaxis protein
VDVEPTDIRFAELYLDLERTFHPIAQTKGIDFRFHMAPNLPTSIYTDRQRLQQVLKNLLSNAFKFTEEGSVTLEIRTANQGWNPEHVLLNQATKVIAFSVNDTGIGIPVEKQRLIFEAFQQADTGTSRKYGGTGLGLAISREIATLLGGEINIVSDPGQGSTFTFYMPLIYTGPVTFYKTPGETDLGEDEGSTLTRSTAFRPSTKWEPVAAVNNGDDRHAIHPGDQVIMIVEDDPTFVHILSDIARTKGFKVVAASGGEESLTLAREMRLNAIMLDIGLPDIDGWTVLDRLKLDPQTRHIPVYIISGEEDWIQGLRHGAFAYLTKPVTREALEAAFT